MRIVIAMVMNPGLGSYVAVTFRSSDTVRGYVGVIADDHFALRVDPTPVLADIAYGDVQWVGPVPQLILRPRPPSPKIENTVLAAALAGYFAVAIVECQRHSGC